MERVACRRVSPPTTFHYLVQQLVAEAADRNIRVKVSTRAVTG